MRAQRSQTKKKRKPKTLRDLVLFFAQEGWEVELVMRPTMALVAKPKARKPKGKK